MGLAVLPSRLKNELSDLADAIMENKDISSDETLSKHAPWLEKIRGKYSEINGSNIDEILRTETGLVFARVLEDAGVYKCTESGREAFERFIAHI